MSCVIEIRPGEGGRDAETFGAELAAAITAYARTRHDTATRRAGADGSRTIVVDVSGPAEAYEPLAGVHRIQRIPKTDKRGRRHTSTATVCVLEPAARPAPIIRDDDLEITAYKGSGPGGQHRNKTSSAVRIHHVPTGIVVTAEDSRSQWQNRRAALAKLTALLGAEAAEAGRVETDSTRRRQVAPPERPAKTWTHNTQRGEVLCHETGQVWRWAEFYRGRIERAG